jgi:hypothetical protein
MGRKTAFQELRTLSSVVWMPICSHEGRVPQWVRRLAYAALGAWIFVPHPAHAQMCGCTPTANVIYCTFSLTARNPVNGVVYQPMLDGPACIAHSMTIHHPSTPVFAAGTASGNLATAFELDHVYIHLDGSADLGSQQVGAQSSTAVSGLQATAFFRLDQSALYRLHGTISSSRSGTASMLHTRFALASNTTFDVDGVPAPPDAPGVVCPNDTQAGRRAYQVDSVSPTELTISHVGAMNPGKYSLSVIGTGGAFNDAAGGASSASYLIELTLEILGIVSITPEDLVICRSDTANFRVSTNNVMASAYQWQWRLENNDPWLEMIDGRNADPVSGADVFAATGVHTDSVTEVRTARRLVFGGWEQRCVITAACGTVTSDSARLSLCFADFNCDSAVNSQDFFDFASCFLSAVCVPGTGADFNEDGMVNSQDFFDFLGAFFAGC